MSGQGANSLYNPHISGDLPDYPDLFHRAIRITTQL